ncbi:MAG TPA: hypothetical protein VMF86_10515 [Stellaceae bacterium]|nr:hypothetical protein [Stellaceae bacterium]
MNRVGPFQLSDAHCSRLILRQFCRCLDVSPATEDQQRPGRARQSRGCDFTARNIINKIAKVVKFVSIILSNI